MGHLKPSPRAGLRSEWLWLAASGLGYLGVLLATGCSGGDATSGGGRPMSVAGQGPSGAGSGGSGAASSGAGTSAAGDDGFGNGDNMGVVHNDGGLLDDSGLIHDPDEQSCGGVAVMPTTTMEVIPGNILLVFDRSGSMKDNFAATGLPKWQEARDAVLNAITPLQDRVTVGAIFFPHAPACDDDGCCVPAFGSDPQINFMPGPDFISTWNTFWSTAPEVSGSTPTFEALEVAGQALTASLGTLTGKTTVVLITDGDPRCTADLQLPGLFPTPEQITAALNAQIALLTQMPTQWLLESVNTYVLGIPGADQPNAVTVLNGVAAAGGTTQHISAADPTTLQTELAKIISESVTTSLDSCTIGLPREPPNPDDVVLVVVESGTEQAVARDLGTGGGWTLFNNNTEIVLQGELCNQARAGAYDRISAVFGCVDLPPLPPPKPD